jgi:hypothetical protein
VIWLIIAAAVLVLIVGSLACVAGLDALRKSWIERHESTAFFHVQQHGRRIITIRLADLRAMNKERGLPPFLVELDKPWRGGK